MADLTIVVSQAEIAGFVSWLVALSALGAAFGAGLVGFLRDALRELWYWQRRTRRLARWERHVKRLVRGQGNEP